MIKRFYNNYNIDTKKQYLIVFVGNFSPPHKGHFSLIERFLKYDNVQINIYVVGDEKRHGIKKSVSFNIWEKYISYFDKKIFIKSSENFSEIFKYQKIDVFLFLKGNELSDYIENLKLKYEKNIKKLRMNGVLFHFLYIERIPKISSTELCKNLDKLEFYLPNFLTELDRNQIKSEIKGFNNN